MQQTPKASPKQHTKRPSRPQRQPAATTATGKTYIPSQKEIHQKATRSAQTAHRSQATKNATGKHPTAPRAASGQTPLPSRSKAIRGRIVLFLSFFLLFLLISIGLFFLNLHHYEKPGFSYYTVKIGDVKKGTSVPYRKMLRNGTLYINLTPVLELCDIVTTGDTQQLRFTTDPQTGENVMFYIGTREAECNGIPIHLAAPTILENGDVYVPYDFLATYVRGLQCSYDEKTHTVTITRSTSDDGENSVPVTFLLKGNQPMQGIDETANFPVSNALGLKADVSAYESFMNPADRDAFLAVASVATPVDQTFEPQNLTQVINMKKDGRPLQYMVETAEKASEALFAELRANGFTDVGITVGYVSYSFQNYYYTHRNDESIDAPGTNDTVLGLSFKIDYMESVANFDATDAGKWLTENAWKFGFIKRYPADKTAQTGYAYVPNQYRFVGRYHAMRIHASGQCLEEYITSLQTSGYLPASTSE